jgi:hypothetical protein
MSKESEEYSRVKDISRTNESIRRELDSIRRNEQSQILFVPPMKNKRKNT